MNEISALAGDQWLVRIGSNVSVTWMETFRTHLKVSLVGRVLPPCPPWGCPGSWFHCVCRRSAGRGSWSYRMFSMRQLVLQNALLPSSRSSPQLPTITLLVVRVDRMRKTIGKTRTFAVPHLTAAGHLWAVEGVQSLFAKVLIETPGHPFLPLI